MSKASPTPVLRIRQDTRAVSELRAYAHNSKTHPQSQIEAIKASITAFGFNDPIGITEDGVIVEGHGRLMAAMQLGMDTVPVIVLSADLTQDMIDLYRIAHNKIALNSTFDFAALAAQLREIVEGAHANFADMGFDSASAATLFQMVDAPVPTNGTTTETRHTNAAPAEFEIVWATEAERDRFKAFMVKAQATYGEGSGDTFEAVLADAVAGNLTPTGLRANPASAENVENLSWH